jgi:Holliday junction resolvasome RuvABC ATP-dependent DNA helicase subunit
MIAAMTNTFEDIIGQSSTKSTLQLYIDAYKETGRLPHISLVGAKGCGKSAIVRKFREGLRRPDGSRPPILELNCATIKNKTQFFEHVYPVWTNHKAVLFGDEIHTLPTDLQSIFLTILEVRKEAVRTVEHEGVAYEFDFNKISFLSATTDFQKLLAPLQDRLRQINLEEYNDEQLFEIFEQNLENKIEIKDCAKDAIMQTFRGNPRDAVVKADDLKTFAAAKKLKEIKQQDWVSFSRTMGVLPLGLTSSEIQVIKAIGKKRECSLNDISAITGFDRSLIQRNLEGILVRKGLMSVDGKRRLTGEGTAFYHQFCK